MNLNCYVACICEGSAEQAVMELLLDSRRENFNLSKAYVDKVDVIDIITAPEIEMLIIFMIVFNCV